MSKISQLDKVKRYQPCNAKVKKSCAYVLLFKRWLLGFKPFLKGKRTSCYLLYIVVLNVVFKFYHAQGKEESCMEHRLLNAKIHIMNTRPGCFCAKDCLDSVEMYTWWYTVLHCAALGCTRLRLALLVCTRLNWAVVGCSRLYCGVLGCTGLYWADSTAICLCIQPFSAW